MRSQAAVDALYQSVRTHIGPRLYVRLSFLPSLTTPNQGARAKLQGVEVGRKRQVLSARGTGAGRG